jgi:uncharacterized delta-60 repeat protein
MPRSSHRRSITLLVTLAVGASLVLLTSPPATAAPGDLDPTFSEDGIAPVPFFDDGGGLLGVARDGAKIVAVGSDWRVARLLSSGLPDTTFGGGDGWLTGNLPFPDIGADDAVVDGDGRITVVGYASDGTSSRVAVARYRPGGGLDRSFSDDGWVTATSPDGVGYVYGYAAALQPDGKLVVAAESYDGSVDPIKANMVVYRFTTGGRLDRTFDGDGRMYVDLGAEEAGLDVALTSRNGIVVSGWTHDVINDDWSSVVVRLLPNGEKDVRFSGDGIRIVNALPNDEDYARTVEVTDDDGIVLGVETSSSGQVEARVVQLTSRGRLDQGFGGGDGIASGFGQDFQFQDLKIRSDGTIAGVGAVGGALSSFVLRASGRPLGTYGIGGVATTSTDGDPRAMLVDAKDRIVAVGTTETYLVAFRLRR